MNRHSIDGVSVGSQQGTVLVSWDIQTAYGPVLGSNGNGEAVRSQPNCSYGSLMLSLQVCALVMTASKPASGAEASLSVLSLLS